MFFITDSLRLFGSFVKFSHTVFSLPFALGMFAVTAKFYPVTFRQFLWIIVALISARTAAMSFNRIVDVDFDKQNPRTSSRELPSGKLTLLKAYSFLFSSSIIFILSSLMLGFHCFLLSFLVLFILFFYSYTKRFTYYSHYVLGLCLALAPGGVWYALTDTFSLVPVPLMLGVLFWVAGFDIIYSLQDVNFDKKHKLFSLPAVFGEKKALFIAKLSHIGTVLMLFLFGKTASLGAIYYIFILIFSFLLYLEHKAVNPSDLRSIDKAFFTRNAQASFLFVIGVVLDLFFKI
ncbi:MAG: 4-hydroxybenzoate octaprenyltransferase [Candidatus Dadabacteria bacterium]|nr:MAG: 4-hydroxybenzoate octaprenyltransferase [Candidatus Dadabacteria bacterium]